MVQTACLPPGYHWNQWCDTQFSDPRLSFILLSSEEGKFSTEATALLFMLRVDSCPPHLWSITYSHNHKKYLHSDSCQRRHKRGSRNYVKNIKFLSCLWSMRAIASLPTPIMVLKTSIIFSWLKFLNKIFCNKLHLPNPQKITLHCILVHSLIFMSALLQKHLYRENSSHENWITSK